MNDIETIIERLESIERKLEELRRCVIPATPPIYFPLYDCIDIYGHNFPSPWNGIFPPSCTKCGKRAYDSNVTISEV